MNYVLNTIHGWGISARAHVHTALLYLRNGLTDCVQIWYVGWRSLSKCFSQVMGGVGHLCTCARAPPSPYLRIRVVNCAKICCVARDPIVTRFTRVGGGVTTFARACPVSLSRKPLSPGYEATPKTDLSLSRSLVHRQTWRLTGSMVVAYLETTNWHQTSSNDHERHETASDCPERQQVASDGFESHQMASDGPESHHTA